MFENDLFGDSIAPEAKENKLSETWHYPPFSVLSARDGWWQERKRQWLALGIKSELGRGGAITREISCEGLITTPKGNLQRMASPGGNLMPAANYSHSRARGDGRGRPIDD